MVKEKIEAKKANSARPKLIPVIIILLILITSVYFLFFFRQKCTAQDCFLEGLWKCKRIDFVSEDPSIVWSYSIKGFSGDSCKVDVKILEVKTGEQELKQLEGREMECLIPKGFILMPETKIEYCHGILKESIQDQIIEKMHLYIVQNIGEINRSAMGITGAITGA